MTNEELFERAKQLVQELCGKEHGYEVTLINDAYSDPSIEIDGMFGIYWNEEMELPIPSIAGPRGTRPGYQLYSVDYDPGVRYYPDGSGEPPSADVVDIGEPQADFDTQVLEALKLAMEKRLYDFQEMENEQRYAEELEEEAGFVDWDEPEWQWFEGVVKGAVRSGK